MNLDELSGRHQDSLMRARVAACSEARHAHAGLASAYAKRIAAMKHAATPLRASREAI